MFRRSLQRPGELRLRRAEETPVLLAERRRKAGSGGGHSEDVAANDPLKGCSDGQERKASSRFTATAGEAGEGGQDVCEALAESCKVSLEAGPERKTPPSDVQSRGGDQRQDAATPPATGTAKDGEGVSPREIQVCSPRRQQVRARYKIVRHLL